MSTKIPRLTQTIKEQFPDLNQRTIICLSCGVKKPILQGQSIIPCCGQEPIDYIQYLKLQECHWIDEFTILELLSHLVNLSSVYRTKGCLQIESWIYTRLTYLDALLNGGTILDKLKCCNFHAQGGSTYTKCSNA